MVLVVVAIHIRDLQGCLEDCRIRGHEVRLYFSSNSGEGQGKTRASSDLGDKPPFDFLPCPGRFPQKGEAGSHARIMEETADRNATSHLSPTMPRDQLGDDRLKCHPMQRIASMGER